LFSNSEGEKGTSEKSATTIRGKLGTTKESFHWGGGALVERENVRERDEKPHRRKPDAEGYRAEGRAINLPVPEGH